MLADSWRQQPGTPAYCVDVDVDASRLAGLLTAAVSGQAPARRDRALQTLGEYDGEITNDVMLSTNRSVYWE